MTRRNDKRNNRRNSRQRNNNPEVSPFAQMILGAILSKGAGMIANALMDKAGEKTEDKPHTGIRQSDNLLESSCIINGDGSATEIPIPDGFQIFISEDGKPMIRKKIEGDEKKIHDVGNGVREAIRQPITYDDICKKFFLDKKMFFIVDKEIAYGKGHDENYNDFDNCTSEAQAKRMAAFNKLQNIAKYLNNGWKPTFGLGKRNWSICNEGNNYLPLWVDITENCSVYFKSEEAANEAIRLMGENSLNDLFSTDW